MPGIDDRPRSIAGRWVFYQEQYWSKTTPYRFLLKTAETAIRDIDVPRQTNRSVQTLYECAKNEAEKEVELLNKVFGGNVKLDPFNPDFYLMLIKELNHSLQLKETYERALKSLEQGKAYGSPATYFYSYLIEAWNRRFGKDGNLLTEEILDKMDKNKTLTFVQAVEEILDGELMELVRTAIKDLLKSGDLSKNDTDHSYETFLQFLDTFHGNELANQLYEIYHLDEIKQALLEQANVQDMGLYLTNNEIQNTFSKTKYADGGLSLEHFENFVVNTIFTNIKSNEYKIEAIHTGKTKMKADNIITIGINSNTVKRAIDRSTYGTREKNVKAIKELGKHLRHLDDGFIIYSNAKNYSINEGFQSRGGFKSGEDISLETFYTVISHFQNASVLIGLIANTIPGAIYDTGKGALEEVLATDIAYFLFDDVLTIGKGLTNKVSALHIFNLDGIYIPLSYLLFELARAMEEGTANPRSIASVKIKTPAFIKYDDPETNMGMELWKDQRTTALKDIKIGATFLKNFQELIGKLN